MKKLIDRIIILFEKDEAAFFIIWFVALVVLAIILTTQN